MYIALFLFGRDRVQIFCGIELDALTNMKNTFGGKGVPEHMDNLSWKQFVKSTEKSIHRNIGTRLLITCFNLNGTFQHVVSFIIFLLEHIEAAID
jgi:hypothetical protein